MSTQVQLAQSYTGFPSGVAYLLLEPKIDGWRMTATINAAGAVRYASRTGQAFDGTRLAYVTQELQRRGLRSVVLDGELSVDGTWGGVAQVRSGGPPLEGAEFWVFDLPGPGTQAERSARLHRLIGRPSAHVRATTQVVARTDAQARAAAVRFLKEGFEGAVAKDPSAPYRAARTAAWTKIKAFDTLEAVVTGITEGTGRNAGRVGALEAVTQEGVRFRVGSGLSDADRRHWWQSPRQIVGKVIEVKYQPGDVATVRFGTLVRVRVDRTAWRPRASPARVHVVETSRVGRITQRVARWLER